MKTHLEIKKKLLEELMGMMGDMDMEDMPKKGSEMMVVMMGKGDHNTMDDMEGDDGMEEEEDMQGMDPRLMDIIKKKKSEKMGGMRMVH